MSSESAASIPQLRNVVENCNESTVDRGGGSSIPIQQNGTPGEEMRNNPQGLPLKYFFLKPNLLGALSVVGATQKPYIFKEILGLLKAYLFQNRFLIDSKDSRIVNCGGTSLGRAFGVEKFEYSEVRYLLSQNIICASYITSNSTCVNNHQSNNSSSSPCTSSQTTHKPHSKIHIQILIPEIPESQSGPESDYSCQGYETALCQDSDGENTEEESEEVEYELVTEEEDSIKELNDSESDVESLILILGLEEKRDSDEDCFADESDSSTDSETPSEENSTEDERDQWSCVTCGIKNKPFMRYCLKCWELRKDWYPDRPTRRRRRKPRPKKDKKKDKKRGSFEGQNLNLETDSNNKETKNDDLPLSLERTSSSGSSCTVASTSSACSAASTSTASSQDSGFGSQDLISFEMIPTRKRKISETKDSKDKVKRVFESGEGTSKLEKKFKKFCNTVEGKRWLKSSRGKELMEAMHDVISDSETEQGGTEGYCTLCYARPKDASIIHGRLSHIGFCYPCAKRLYNSKAKCPICRRKIHMITKNSFV